MDATEVAIIGAPMDLGAGRRGVDMGPSAVRAAGLHARLASLGYSVRDLGNIEVVQPESTTPKSTSARFLDEIAASCTRLAKIVERAASAGQFPLILGGDHSIAAGSLAGLAKYYRKSKAKFGLIWIDAHADMNIPATSPSGNVHGMPLAAALGMGPRELTHIGGFAPKVSPQNTVLIGLRDVDPAEGVNVRESGVLAFTMRDVDELGLRQVMRRAIAAASDGTEGIHLSFDMDSIDPDYAPGVGTPVSGGLTYREAHLAMETVSDSKLLRSLEIVEVNPILDTANRTALLAVELIASAMGKRILP
ncbi:arginase [Bryobacter aggregatus]|uniref:arginase n=1 Tax=Bryobacter aggregatus TaxID=360054 RepID=UPI0004E14D9B|nr:arginase [Bryobacter aggregatus]